MTGQQDHPPPVKFSLYHIKFCPVCHLFSHPFTRRAKACKSCEKTQLPENFLKKVSRPFKNLWFGRVSLPHGGRAPRPGESGQKEGGRPTGGRLPFAGKLPGYFWYL